jgi:hypothetical protein
VILCTTSGESDYFLRSLRTIADIYGFKIYLSSYVPAQSNGRRKIGGTIRDQIVREALRAMVTAEYVVCMDADTTSSRALGELVDELSRRGADLASVELIPQDSQSGLVQLQRHEYRRAIRLRFVMPWLISGACHVGKASAMRMIMEQHSLFFQRK